MIETSVSLLPVFIFLIVLIYFDSYKLIKVNVVLFLIACGGLAAGASYLVNRFLLESIITDLNFYVRYISPLIEELIKASLIIYFISKNKIGFLVDAAIYGFAIGAGFAFIENIYYLSAVESSSIFLWIIRGFGTAVMHGGTTAIFSIITRNMYDRQGDAKMSSPKTAGLAGRFLIFLTIIFPGFMSAVVIHSFFNHLVLPALAVTVLQLILLPTLIVYIFKRSEAALRDWLEKGLDNEVQLLEQIDNGIFSETKAGQYLLSLQNNFSGATLADMLCMIKLHVELSIKAKGVLLMRKVGLHAVIEDEVKEKLQEMKFLEKSIGPTGILAVSPIFTQSTKDLWQIYMIA